MMVEKLKLLFVCTINRMRSATAQVIYENDDRFEVKSAGTDRNARVVVDRELLEWADAIIVMEKYHRNKIRSKCAPTPKTPSPSENQPILSDCF